MSTIAIIGVGAMGARIARRFLDADHQVTVWNRTPARAVPLAAVGATAASSPAEAASRAGVVVTMVADPHSLSAVTEGPDGIAAGIQSGTTVIEMSTVGPQAISRLASALPPGTRLLDAPVLGSLAEAESGRLRIFVGGPADDVARHRELLSTLGTPMHVGPLGAGAAAKLVANSTLFGALAVLGEAIALADGCGLSRDATFEVLAATPLAAQAQRRRPVIEAGEYQPRFALPLARKDADLILTAATALGLRLPVAQGAYDWLRSAEAAGWAGHDYSAVLAHILAQHKEEH